MSSSSSKPYWRSYFDLLNVGAPVNVKGYFATLSNPYKLNQLDLYLAAKPTLEQRASLDGWWEGVCKRLVTSHDSTIRKIGAMLRHQQEQDGDSGRMERFWKDVEVEQALEEDRLANLKTMTAAKQDALLLKSRHTGSKVAFLHDPESPFIVGGTDVGTESFSTESASSSSQSFFTKRHGEDECDETVVSPSVTSSTKSRSATKKKQVVYTTEEPWHSLTISLTRISLQEYQAQSPQEKDIILVKDAQVAMSCVLNTMSRRVCDHFDMCDDLDLVKKARSLTLIADLEKHPSASYMQRYVDTLAEKGVEYLHKKIVVDRGALLGKYMDEEYLPAQAQVEDKVLRILTYLCEFVIHPPFLAASPLENDCLHVWASIFGILADKVSLHTGEKALEASKVMRKLQSTEYSDTSDAGRKVDCLFMMQGVELSNIEFKHQDASARDLAIQNRKNVRLARCIQEAHTTYGVKEASVLMADVFGFVGVFYQVKPMGDIAIAGKTTSTLVHLPRTAGALEVFLQDQSLAILWNFMLHLEQQGPKVIRAKERFELAQEKTTLERALSMSRVDVPSAISKTFQHNVTLAPSKKRK
ncbi:hypothetical protein BGZ98_001046 [Dissophora globulifera]|nr:hypothetical protein BGZ98_001046 [Dissophora globulifera]